MKIDKRNPQHWLLLLRQGIYSLIAIAARYVSRRPRKPVVVLYGHQLSGNLKALYHAWELGYRDKFDCYFLSLDPEYWQALQEQGIPVLRCAKLSDMLLVGRCDVLITDHGLHAMRPFVALTSIRLVDVWHGIPFKGFIPDDFRVQRRYDEVWVSSPLLKQVYQDKFGFPPEIVHNLGYARSDKLFRRETPDPGLREQLSIPANHRIVLYAPTWQQDDKGRELFPFGESQDEFLQRLSDACREHTAILLIRSHLNARIGARSIDNVRYCSMKDFPDSEGLLLHTDILICDWSSIAFDFLALERPAIFLDVEPPFNNGFTLGPEYRYGGIARDSAALGALLEDALANPREFVQARAGNYKKSLADAYGAGTDGRAAERQWQRLLAQYDRSPNE